MMRLPRILAAAIAWRTYTPQHAAGRLPHRTPGAALAAARLIDNTEPAIPVLRPEIPRVHIGTLPALTPVPRPAGMLPARVLTPLMPPPGALRDALWLRDMVGLGVDESEIVRILSGAIVSRSLRGGAR